MGRPRVSNNKKATDWVNEKLLAEWAVKDLRANNITVPVKPNVVSNWMKEAGFQYAAYKKSYYVDRHEALGIIQARNKYLKQNFKDEINKNCWLQMLLEEYKSAMKMERKGEDEEEVRKFIESRSYKYIYKNGQLTVEVNMYDLKKQ